MQPDHIQIHVRARHPWEAIDLGFQLLRSWPRQLYGAWFALVVPTMAAWIFVSWPLPWLTVFGLWWFKPLFERVPLHVLSEALFGQPPSVSATARSAPRWLRGGLLVSLTTHRVSLTRSMLLPILQLEGLSGSRRAQRAQQLIRPASSHALWLLLACGVFQAVPLTLGVGSLALAVLPPETQLSDALADLWSIGSEAAQLRGFAVLYVISLSAVEPLYVACGFALYINRRIFTEGWDIELIFRKLDRRLPTRARAATGLGLLLALVLSAWPTATRADACDMQRADQASQCIDEVLSDPVFGGKATGQTWRLRFRPSSAERIEGGVQGTGGEFLSRVMLVVALLSLALLAVRLRHHVRRGPRPAGSPRSSARELGAELLEHAAESDEPIPNDLVAHARAHFADGDPERALSLLYRGALRHLERLGIPTPFSATEAQCARLVRRVARDPLASDFDSLVRAWELCAYARRPPERRSFGRIADAWERHLAATPEREEATAPDAMLPPGGSA